MAPVALPDHDQHWSLESLNKAYQQGYMAGLTGHGLRHGDVARVIGEHGLDGEAGKVRESLAGLRCGESRAADEQREDCGKENGEGGFHTRRRRVNWSGVPRLAPWYSLPVWR